MQALEIAAMGSAIAEYLQITAQLSLASPEITYAKKMRDHGRRRNALQMRSVVRSF